MPINESAHCWFSSAGSGQYWNGFVSAFDGAFACSRVHCYMFHSDGFRSPLCTCRLNWVGETS